MDKIQTPIRSNFILTMVPTVSAPEDIVVPLPETGMRSMDQPEQIASAASSAESVPAMLAKIQAQISQFSTQLPAQQTQLSKLQALSAHYRATQQARFSTQQVSRYCPRRNVLK
jgi:hypothetical protein